jgi:hypothetical protein
VVDITDAEVFGNTAQTMSVPTNLGLSDAEVFGTTQTAPLASTSASPQGGITDAEVFGTPPSSHLAATRGLVTSFTQQQPDLMAKALEGLSHVAPDYFKESLKSGAKYMQSVGTTKPGYELTAPKLQELANDPNMKDALTWAGETFGQGAASTAAPIALGTIGGAIGTAIAPGIGTAIGAGGGAVIGGLSQNYGEVFKALQDAGVEDSRAAKVGMAVLPIISALDVAGMIPGAAALGLRAAKSTILKKLSEALVEKGGETLFKTTAKSGAAEAVTEGAQEFVKQAAVTHETGKPLFTSANTWDIIENALGGGLVGAPFGAGAHGIGKLRTPSVRDTTPPTSEEVQDAFKDYTPDRNFNGKELDILRRMVTQKDALAPEGGNFEPSVVSAMAPTTEVSDSEVYGPGPLWYSKAEQAAQSLPESGTAQDMRNRLMNQGVKHEELTWTGLDDFFQSKGANIQATQESVMAQEAPAATRLAEWKTENPKQQPPKELIQAVQQEKVALQKARGEEARAQAQAAPTERVTKQDILSHLRENRYVLKEQIRDDITSPQTPQEIAAQEEFDRVANRRQELDQHLDAEGPDRLQGRARYAALEEWNQAHARLNELSNILQGSIKKAKPQYSQYAVPGERRGYGTLNIQVPANEKASDMMAETPNRYGEDEIRRAREFKPDHFAGEEYKNTVGFVTFTLREDLSGHLTVHLENVQTDLHQLAREMGYITKAMIEQEQNALNAQDIALSDLANFIKEKVGNNGWEMIASKYDARIRNIADEDVHYTKGPSGLDRVAGELMTATNDSNAVKLVHNYYDAVRKRMQISEKINGAVRDAPYKMTQDWTRLLLKRVLRWAADKGIQRVSWNNGELAFQYSTGGAGVMNLETDQNKKLFKSMQKHYDETIPSVARGLARQYGGNLGITQIKTSTVGPWVARPFVANGVVTGWGYGRWEGSEDVFGQTYPFSPSGQRTFPTEAEANSQIAKLQAERRLQNSQTSKFSNQVMYIEFDRRAQWNFQVKGMPSFMVDPGLLPTDVINPDPLFTVHEDVGLMAPQFQTPTVTAARKFAQSLKEISKKFGMESKLNVVLLARPIKLPPGMAVKRPMAVHQKTNGIHYIQVDMDYFNNNLKHLADSTRIPFMWAAMMHEFGHAVMVEHFSKLPGNVKMAIEGAHDKFLADTAGIRKLGDRMARRFSAIQVITSGDAWAMKDWNALTQGEREYWAHFDEWFADQVARWATTSDRPLSIVEKTFAGISDLLHRVFRMVSERFGLGFRADVVMEEWLNSFMDTEGSFTHTQYLDLQAEQVKTDQRAVAGEEPEMFIPPRSPEGDTVRMSAMAATAGSTPKGVASSAVHASRFNWMYKYMGNLAHLAQANPYFEPLIRYVERIRRMHLDESNIHDAAVRIQKDWRNLGNEQADNLTAFINDLVNLDFLTPAEKAAGVIRQPNPTEQIALATKHKLNKEGLKVFGKIKILNDMILDLHRQTAIKSATRAISNPATLFTKITEIDFKVDALKNRPFFPFMRFGRHYVIQKDRAGNTVHFETFERIGFKSAERQQQQRVEDLQKQFPGYPAPEVGILPEASSPFVGLPPMLLEEIRNKLTLTPSQNEALEMLMYNHSTATKFPRAFKQNYTKGYSMDFRRSFARYFFYAGKYYARAEHAAELNDDIHAARLIGGNIATKISNFMSDHLKNTVLEAKGDFGVLKGGIFLWAMGYVPAAATQNLTQTPMITFPYLAAKFGDIKATKALVKAMSDFKNFYKRGAYEKTGVRKMEALDYGVKKGVITQSQASELAASSQGMNLLKGIGGNTAQRFWQAFMEKSAWMFEMAEQVNRRIAYSAAYDLALENPNAKIVQEAINAYRAEFNSLASKYGDQQYAAAIITASYVTTATQYDYSRAFRPRVMRGRLPGTLFVFKTYMANTLWMLAGNKSDVLPRFLMVSALMGGLAGIPGYEDLRDILKALGHWMNKDFNVEHALREFVNSHFDGKIPPDMIIGGLARRGYGIPALLDMLGSFATGTPGRGFDGKMAGQNVPFPVLDRHRAITLGPLLPVELGKVFDPTDDVNRTIAEQSQRASGAVFSVAFNMYKAIMDNKLAATDPKRWERAIPRELADITRTWRAFNEGRERSRGGVASAPTIAEFNWRDSEQAGEMVAMAAGYQPLRVQAKWDSIMAKVEVEKFYEMQQKTLFGQLFEARKANNPGEVDSVLESIRRFNRELPPIARGYTITSENALKSIQGRERELVARERGVPTQKRNVPISRYVDTLFPETTVDVRRVK